MPKASLLRRFSTWSIQEMAKAPKGASTRKERNLAQVPWPLHQEMQLGRQSPTTHPRGLETEAKEQPQEAWEEEEVKEQMVEKERGRVRALATTVEALTTKNSADARLQTCRLHSWQQALAKEWCQRSTPRFSCSEQLRVRERGVRAPISRMTSTTFVAYASRS